MAKTVAIIGSLDTKGEEFAFVKDIIEKQGLNTFVIDTGVRDKPAFPPDVSASEVAQAAGADLAYLKEKNDRGVALDAMAAGVAIVAKKYYDLGKFDGIMSMGGGGGTGVGSSAMRALPVGVPKLLVSTVASADTSPYVGTSDIMMMPSIVDVAGLNTISQIIFTNAANAIAGMVKNLPDRSSKQKRPMIAASMFGNTTKCVNHAREILESKGYEVLVFHCTGTGGKTMEMLIGNGYFQGVLDVTTTEWADEVCGGVLSATEHRLEAAAAANIPQIVTPACIDMCNFWGEDTIPEKYKADRLFFHWNPNVTLMRTNLEENKKMGEIFAEKLNKATAPIKILIPLKGFSELDAPGELFWWPEANQAFIDALKANLREDIEVIMMDNNVNDPEFSTRCAEELLGMLS